MVGTGHREKTGGRKNGEKTDRFGTEPIYGIPDGGCGKQARQLYGTKEHIQVDLLEKNHVDFEAQYRTYLAEQSLLRYFGYGESSECMPEIDSIQLAKCINRLKGRERGILFARVFGELDFAELGKKFGMEPKQAEMAYYYIIRKLRKGMGVRKDEF